MSLASSIANAQELSGGQIAVNVEVQDTDAAAGDVLSITSDDNLVKSSSSYDKNLFGVVVDSPEIELNTETSTSVSVLSQGEAQVKVSTKNGSIEVGDFITSSDESGVGQKATESGIALGKALGAFSGDGQGTIPVSINIAHQSLGAGDFSEFWARLSALTSSAITEPENLQTLLRYLLAFIIAVASFILGFIFAARALRTGLVALGRNPLAAGTIQAGMFLNLLAVITLAGAGVGLSLFLILFR